jgi:EAL domain-containing protein (putative c-di-GMP-specific phosphodiesterase class I)
LTIVVCRFPAGLDAIRESFFHNKSIQAGFTRLTMSEGLADSRSVPAEGGQRASLCFVIDPDFGFLQGFSKSLRSVGVDTVELISSARLAENVHGQNPEIVFLDLNPVNPYECVRALMSLRECRFPGRVQLLGRCETAFLEIFRRVGVDASLAMLPGLQKPVDFASIRKIVLDQKLNCQTVAAPDLSLKTAIARDYVTFWYQPKIDLKRRQVVGAEAFARIAHPQHGILPPARFLAGAAEEDLLELANRALASALQLSERMDEQGVSLQIAINLSVESIMKLPIAELLLKHRPRKEARPSILFDVTESQILNKVTILREKFHELEKHGISLAIDNFGRGNSSFSLFRYLPFSEIKIDMSFVQGCASNAGNANVCKSMIQIAHNFARKAVAVGIETGEDAQELANLGCDIAQGFIFGKPMTDRKLMTMVTAGRAQSQNFVGAAV